MNYQDFIKQLDRSEVPPVYLFTGEEAFLQESALQKLLDRLLQPSERDFNYIQIDGKGSTARQVLDEAMTLPVFASKRFVVLKDAESMVAAEANQLTDYLKNPSTTTCLAVVSRKIDLRRTFFQTLSRNHPTVECKPLPETLLPRWLRQQADHLGTTLSDDASSYLIEQIGTDLFMLRNELIKASLIAEPNKTITRDHIRHAYRGAEGYSVSDLLLAVGERRTAEAVRIVKDLMGSGEAPLLILSALSRQFRQLSMIRQLLLAEVPDKMIQNRLNIWRAAWTALLRQTKAYGMDDLLWGLRRLTETDAGLKGNSMAAELIMETLVIDLTMGKKKGLRRFLGGKNLIYLER